jgi:hypothetical protein
MINVEALASHSPRKLSEGGNFRPHNPHFEMQVHPSPLPSSRFQSGKVTFSYIYGIGVLGCLAFYCLLSLMATCNVTLGAVISVLGYCLLPMVALSGINVLITIQ